MAEPPSEKPRDPKQPQDPLLNYDIGYPRLAARMSLSPETAAFRRFDALNIRNLLYLQAELVNMEKDLYELEQRDEESGHVNESCYATNCTFLDFSEQDGDTNQLDHMMEIQKELKEYSSFTKLLCWSETVSCFVDETLLRLVAMQNLHPSVAFDMTDLQHF